MKLFLCTHYMPSWCVQGQPYCTIANSFKKNSTPNMINIIYTQTVNFNINFCTVL